MAGTDIGLVVTGAHDPLVLIVAPFVVVIMYAAIGVGEGLRKGLEYKIVRWLTGHNPEADEDGAWVSDETTQAK